jgi:hypothetical protein
VFKVQTFRLASSVIVFKDLSKLRGKFMCTEALGYHYVRVLLFQQSWSLICPADNVFRTGCPERDLQMVQLSDTRGSCIAILWVSLVCFVAIAFCVASQRVFIVFVVVISLSTQSGNLWIYPHTRQPWMQESSLSKQEYTFVFMNL